MTYQCKYYISTPQDENGNLLPDKPISNLDAFLTISEQDLYKGRVEIYNIIEGHSEADIDYVEACKEITLDEYKELTKGWFTPIEYLGGMENMNNTIVGISVEQLYKTFGSQLQHTTIKVEDNEYFDLYNEKGMVSMDGEECTVLSVDENGTVTLENIECETIKTFKLSKEEYECAVFKN